LTDSKTVFKVPTPPSNTKTTIGISLVNTPSFPVFRFDIADSKAARKSISPPKLILLLSTNIKWEWFGSNGCFRSFGIVEDNEYSIASFLGYY
jgi:hypothetical protein